MSDNLKTGRTYVAYRVDGKIPVYQDEMISTEEIAKRVERLAEIRSEIESVVEAVKLLESDGREKLKERETLKQTLSQLQADKQSAEAILQLPEGSFTRLFERAARKGRIRGLVEGLLIGFLSSVLAWYVTYGIKL